MCKITTMTMDCYENVAISNEGETGACYSSLLDAATMELFLAKNMKDEHGSSVSPSYRGLQALWVK